MISTVTTTTVTTVAVASAAGLSLVAILMLLTLLSSKELISANEHPRLEALGRVLNVVIIPLLMTFGLITIVKVLEALR